MSGEFHPSEISDAKRASSLFLVTVRSIKTKVHEVTVERILRIQIRALIVDIIN